MKIQDYTPTNSELDAIDAIQFALKSSDIPGDGYERAEVRLRIVLGGAYDGTTAEDEAQPLIDLLTDILHASHALGVDIFDLLESAQFMQTEEQKDWGPRDA
jgi:hypothetical protein